MSSDAEADASADADAEADTDSSDATGGYVHTPGDADAATSTSAESTDATKRAPSETDEFGRAGWALTGMLIVCMLVIPGIIYLYPYFLGSFGLSFFGTYLVLPLIPAAVLGLVAVWSMTAAVHDE
ncbi:hypothetical protein [Haloparvum sp. AD34]